MDFGNDEENTWDCIRIRAIKSISRWYKLQVALSLEIEKIVDFGNEEDRVEGNPSRTQKKE